MTTATTVRLEPDLLVLMDHAGEQGIEPVAHRRGGCVGAGESRQAIGAHPQQSLFARRGRVDAEAAPSGRFAAAELGLHRRGGAGGGED